MQKFALTNHRKRLGFLKERTSKKIKSFPLAWVIFTLAKITPVVAQVYLPPLTEGHVDIGAAYGGGTLHLHLHIHGAIPAEDTHQELNESIVRYDFTGGSKSSLLDYQVWKSPHSATPGMPFLGFGAGEVPMGIFAANSLSLAVTGFSFAGWTGLTSGGNFFLLQEDEFGSESLLLNSTATNMGSVGLVAGVHDHGEWAFTEVGIYDINFKLSGLPAEPGATPLEATGTLRFEIIPEPSSGPLLLAGVAAVAMVRRRTF